MLDVSIHQCTCPIAHYRISPQNNMTAEAMIAIPRWYSEIRDEVIMLHTCVEKVAQSWFLFSWLQIATSQVFAHLAKAPFVCLASQPSTHRKVILSVKYSNMDHYSLMWKCSQLYFYKYARPSIYFSNFLSLMSYISMQFPRFINIIWRVHEEGSREQDYTRDSAKLREVSVTLLKHLEKTSNNTR